MAPAIPTNESPIISRFAPTLSRKILIGIWVNAKA